MLNWSNQHVIIYCISNNIDEDLPFSLEYRFFTNISKKSIYSHEDEDEKRNKHTLHMQEDRCKEMDPSDKNYTYMYGSSLHMEYGGKPWIGD